jgi:hypothetical protein
MLHHETQGYSREQIDKFLFGHFMSHAEAAGLQVVVDGVRFTKIDSRHCVQFVGRIIRIYAYPWCTRPTFFLFRYGRV